MQNSDAGAYAALGAAVLTQAVEDYKDAIKYLARHTNIKSLAIDAIRTVKEVERFFFSGTSDMYGFGVDTVDLFKTFQKRHKEVIEKAHKTIEMIERRQKLDAEQNHT